MPLSNLKNYFFSLLECRRSSWYFILIALISSPFGSTYMYAYDLSTYVFVIIPHFPDSQLQICYRKRGYLFSSKILPKNYLKGFWINNQRRIKWFQNQSAEAAIGNFSQHIVQSQIFYHFSFLQRPCFARVNHLY